MTKRPGSKKRTAAKKKSTAKKSTTKKKSRAKKSTAKKSTAKKKSTAMKKRSTSGRKSPATKTTHPAATSKHSGAKTPAHPAPAPAQPAPIPAQPAQPAPVPAQPAQPAPVPARPAGGIGGPAGIRIRMYRVGFGDFFLLSLNASNGVRHILIDCGVHAANLGSIETAIKQLKEDTGGQLALVIMTHRHADHIAGFAIGADDFKTFTVERVWMPWFENRNDGAAVKIQASLTAVAGRLTAALAASDDPDAEQYRAMALNVTGDAAGGNGNDAALKTLHGGFATQAPVDYYEAGQTATLPQSLVDAGVTAQILGPPRDEKLVAVMDNKAHQYLAAVTDDAAEPVRLSEVYRGSAADYPPGAFELLNVEQLTSALEQQQPGVHAAMAAQVDNAINNQSLVVLFTFNGKTMLFPGDAQWGNWDNWLFGGVAVGTDPQLSAAGKTILNKLDFYKVGHHGSTNANPIDAVQALRDGCVAMCSTQPTAYGKPSKGSEVPRVPLLAALDKKTNGQLARSDEVALAADQTTGGKAIPPWPGETVKGEVWPAAPKLPAIFKTGPNGTLYIDYEM
jgi:beta-lactamase superfamily II metal-dependent hydrolase